MYSYGNFTTFSLRFSANLTGRKVFTDVQELQSRYGLSPSVENDDRLAAPEDPRDVRPVQFHVFSNRFQHLLKRSQQSFGILKSGTWAVRDWKKFTLMLDDLLSFNNGLEAITNSVEARQRRPQLIQGALESLQSNLLDLRLVQEATAGNNDSWADTASSIIEQSEVDAADAASSVVEQSEVVATDTRILSWRECIEAQFDIDSKGEYVRPKMAPSRAISKTTATGRFTSMDDIFTLRSTSISLFFITTSCPGFGYPSCCLGRREDNWEADTENEIDSLIDEQIDNSPLAPFYNAYLEQDRKRRTYCYVYCAPCWASIWTAAQICQSENWKDKNMAMIWRIRVDERLDPEYCHARTRLGEALSLGEILKPNNANYGWWLYSDLNHIRRRLRALDERDLEMRDNIRMLNDHQRQFAVGNAQHQPAPIEWDQHNGGGGHRETGSEASNNRTGCDVDAILKEHQRSNGCAALVLIAKAEIHHAFDSIPGYIPFARVPEKNQVYQYRWDHNSPPMREPVFLGTFRNTNG